MHESHSQPGDCSRVHGTVPRRPLKRLDTFFLILQGGLGTVGGIALIVAAGGIGNSMIIAGLGLAIGVSLLGGALPSRRVARLEPLDARRYE